MLKCASCGVEGADEALFCASCGAPLSGETLVTEGAEAPSPTPARIPSAPKPRSGSSSSSTNEGRFLPGALVAGRYRIVALLGKGGMGEVYRADDLTLGQQVALKFLKEATAKDEALLERFRNEVRTARRVSHPNVCRVYDVSETGGHTFLTMEYVDGEDLASLLSLHLWMPVPPLVPRYLWQGAGQPLYHNPRTQAVSPREPLGDARRQRNMELRQAAHGQD